MVKNIKKSTFVYIFILLGLILSCVFSVGVTFATYAEAYKLLDDTAFDYTVPNTGSAVVLKCYPIYGETRSVAVAWGKSDPAATPSSLTIPARVYDENEAEYKVLAIAKSGFRYCDFETISLPTTIREIQSEAFYCCLALTEFTIPHLVTQIAPSTFMDCRNLESVHYSKQSVDANDQPRTDLAGDPICEETNYNDSITIIGDHAFAWCVSLKRFDCPSPAASLSIEESAFQNCKKMMSFLFPLATTSISIGQYAFADCVALTLCYFGPNVTAFGQYAFARCDVLTLYYSATTPQSFGVGFDTNWRKKHPATDKTHVVNDFVPIKDKAGTLEDSGNYPGLYYTVKDGPIYLEATTKGSTAITIDSSRDKYISIFKFDAPVYEKASDYDPNYYTSDKYLKIPNTIKTKQGGTYTVKVIESNAFLDNTTLTGVSFNENLVQIRSRAFYGCTGITGTDGLSFARCESLTEVSYEVFQEADTERTPANTGLTKLHLPSCLSYVGYRAFYNFNNVSSFSFQAKNPDSDPSIKWIGEEAFANLGSNCSSGTVDLVLPKSLSDTECNRCAPKIATNNVPNLAVQKGAFKNAKLFKTVTMEAVDLPSGWDASTPPPYTAPHDPVVTSETFNGYLMSLGESAFQDCSNVIRFTGNKFHHKIGSSCFKGCTNMKEMFLSTYGSRTSNVDYPWGNGSPIFGTSSSIVDLVIYVDDSRAPKNNNQVSGTQWNAESATFNNDYSTNTFNMSRPHVPTYFDVDWSAGAVKYIDIANHVVIPSTNFSSNVIAFVNQGGDYVLTRCYAKSDITDLDLSIIKDDAGDATYTASAKIKRIGDGAFGKDDNGKKPGTKFILPSDLREIGERAFFRKKATEGVSKLTYPGASSNDGECNLPTGLRKLERLAFYNCRFQSIAFPTSALTFLGNTAFVSFPGKEATDTNTLNTTITGATGTNFAVSNNGIYYIGEGQKTLLYQAGKGSGDKPKLTIDSGTLALGVRSVANTNFDEIELPPSLTTVYGGALEHNKKLTKISGGTGLKYIAAAAVCAHLEPPDTDVWNNSTYFDIVDSTNEADSDKYQWVSTFGAFAYSNMETFDFTKLTSLRKIGYGAFQQCKNLKYMTPYNGASDQYKYYKYSSGTAGSVTKTDIAAPTNNEGILDLSKCTDLESIGRYAFGECPKIKYVHLPANSNLYIRTDADSSITSSNQGGYSVFASDSAEGNGGCILVGEKAEDSCYKMGGSAANRYPGTSLARTNTDQRLYFQVKSAEDIIEGITGENAIRYWTDLGNHEFLLFDNKTQVKRYYGVSV